MTCWNRVQFFNAPLKQMISAHFFKDIIKCVHSLPVTCILVFLRWKNSGLVKTKTIYIVKKKILMVEYIDNKYLNRFIIKD